MLHNVGRILYQTRPM